MKVDFPRIDLPASIQIKHDCIKCGIDSDLINKENYYDLQILLYTFHIEKINLEIYKIRNQKLNDRGISRIEEASEDDFDSL